MGTVQHSLCLLLGCFIVVQSVVTYPDARFSQDFVGFYENLEPFSFERNLDFTPRGTIFSSWRSWTPDFHRPAGFSPFLNVPRVQVYCDASALTVLVDKRIGGLKLTGEEMELGNGCISNGELANRFVFTYGFDDCGTTSAVANGLEVFTNTLYLKLRKTSPTWWKTPLAVHVSCFAKRCVLLLKHMQFVTTIPTAGACLYRLNGFPNFSVATLPENAEHVDIKAMTPSWTSAAESDVYNRGQAVSLQVSAKIRPNQQVFIQSCFVSLSPEPRAKPRLTVIFNKGCVTPLGASPTIAVFVASKRADMVNFVMNTSYLISELYIHCSVLISDRGVTSGSKSCNYNVIQSRWEELSGDLEACECCSSRCKGKTLPETKTMVSTGPFVIVDEDVKRHPVPSVSEQQETPNIVPNSMQSALDPSEATVSAAPVPGSKLAAPPQGVVAVSQNPATRVTLWLPEQVQSAEHGGNLGSQSEDGVISQLEQNSNDIPELHSSTTDQEPHPNPTNEIKSQSFSDVSVSDMNLLTMVNGWPIPPQPAIPKEFKIKGRFERSGNSGSKEEQVDFSLPAEINADYLMLVEGPNPESDDTAAAEEPQTEKWLQNNEIKDPNRDEIPPVTRSKLTFSKAADGSRTLSYEEEVVKQKSPVEREPLRLKGLCSTFLNLLRRMNKAE